MVELFESQLEQIESFIRCTEAGISCLLPSRIRQSGKSTILNELGFNLQAMGYRVFLLQTYDHFPPFYCNDMFDFKDYDSKLKIDDVVIVDDYDHDKLKLILDWCNGKGVVVLGYTKRNYSFDVTDTKITLENETVISTKQGVLKLW